MSLIVLSEFRWPTQWKSLNLFQAPPQHLPTKLQSQKLLEHPFKASFGAPPAGELQDAKILALDKVCATRRPPTLKAACVSQWQDGQEYEMKEPYFEGERAFLPLESRAEQPGLGNGPGREVGIYRIHHPCKERQ